MNTQNLVLLYFAALLFTAARDVYGEVQESTHFKISEKRWLQDMLQMINEFRQTKKRKPLCLNA
jgi:hypothetical protein